MSGNLDLSMMYAMHDALRRDLEHITRISARADDDPRRLLASALGWELFKKALHIHHSAEDEALWPVMRDLVGERADDLALLDAMEAEHARIDPLIDSIDAALADPETAPERIAAGTDALATALTAHLKHEESEGLPLVDAKMSQEQWQHYGLVHSEKGGPETPRLIPWVLDGADEKLATSMLSLMPEPVRALYLGQWQPAYAALTKWPTTP
ncbi:hemerythrin domain-containing protein [Streptomyces sp. 184]|uniref:hemerythrin domain-containing protein n=1 Tax=Streptomyces sp. 184 TaxID=1827526 RepID=UPI003891636A